MRQTRQLSAQLPKSPVLPLPLRVVTHHLETLLQWVQSWHAQDRVPPVLLLTGIEGVGKRSMAYLLAQWLLCEKGGFFRAESALLASQDEGPELFEGLFGESSSAAPSSEPATTIKAKPQLSLQGPCNQCKACRRALQASWVEFTEVGTSSPSTESDTSEDSSADSDKSSKLKIESFRDLKTSAGFAAQDGSYRIILIRNAERMTPQAANSLLKLLEEPPTGWVFILTASDPGLLLPTLVSRCQRIRLKPFSESELRGILTELGVQSDRQALSIELAQGSWKKATSLAEDSTWEKREGVLRFLENPPEHLGPILDWASAGAESMDQLVTLLEPCMLSLLKWSSSVRRLDDLASLDPQLVNHAKYASFHLRTIQEAHSFWLNRSERLAKARREVALPLNKKLLAQEILLPYLLS